MKKIYANNLTTLSLGRQGENLARQVVFDIRDLESLYGSGTVEVIHQRPGDAQPYPLAVQRDGTLVTWDVTATDTEMSAATANERYGKCELRYYAGETLAKSQIWRTWVESAMDTPSETTPPEPEQGWVDQVLDAKQTAEKAAVDAKADADRAAVLAAEVAQNASQVAQNVSYTNEAKEAAVLSASEAAQSAQEAAESAAVYGDVVADVNQLKQDLSAEQTAREQADTSLQQEVSGKLPKSPANWGPWTAEEQAAARERMSVENGADFELLVDATLEEEANTFTVTFPKPVRECIYHIWFYNNNGESVTAQTQCIEVGTSNYYLLRYVNVVDSRGYALNGYFRHNGPINTRSIIGYAADSQAASWTSDNPGNGNAAYINYPTSKAMPKVDGLKFFLSGATNLLNVGAKIQVWGR